MVKLYHRDIEFEDPVFGKLKGEKAKNMWRMLCSSSNKIEIYFSNIIEDKNSGSVNWKAEYIFKKTNRKIINNIYAEFKFKDGKIINHKDIFSLYRWAIQAFGLKGMTPMFKTKLRNESHKYLDLYQRRKNRKVNI
jgi:hypothetical protein